MNANAVELLKEEHRRIESVLRCLAAAAHQARTTAEADMGTFSQCLEFLRGYADRSHHHKEEELLFPALERKGIPRQGGPIGVMLEEHALGRDLIRRMDEALRKEHPGWLDELCSCATDYGDLLRAHIEKEDNVLFPMAVSALSDAEMRQLDLLFDDYESAPENKAARDRFTASSDALCAQWKQPAAGG